MAQRPTKTLSESISQSLTTTSSWRKIWIHPPRTQHRNRKWRVMAPVGKVLREWKLPHMSQTSWVLGGLTPRSARKSFRVSHLKSRPFERLRRNHVYFHRESNQITPQRRLSSITWFRGQSWPITIKIWWAFRYHLLIYSSSRSKRIISTIDLCYIWRTRLSQTRTLMSMLSSLRMTIAI